MLERWTAVDKIEDDPAIHEAQRAYLADEITEPELEQRIGRRDDEVLWTEEWSALQRATMDLRQVDWMQTAILHDIESGAARLKDRHQHSRLLRRLSRVSTSHTTGQPAKLILKH